MMPKEIWKNIPGEEAYQVSNTGKVRSKMVVSSKKRNVQDHYHELKPRAVGHGYLGVTIHGKNRKVHRLVAEAFIPNPYSLPVVRHKDDIKSNNHVDNLCWGTQRDNIHDSIRNGRFVGDPTRAIESTRLPILAINIDTSETLKFNGVNDAARCLNLSPGHISEVLHGKLRRTGRWVFERI